MQIFHCNGLKCLQSKPTRAQFDNYLPIVQVTIVLRRKRKNERNEMPHTSRTHTSNNTCTCLPIAQLMSMICEWLKLQRTCFNQTSMRLNNGTFQWLVIIHWIVFVFPLCLLFSVRWILHSQPARGCILQVLTLLLLLLFFSYVTNFNCFFCCIDFVVDSIVFPTSSKAI